MIKNFLECLKDYPTDKLDTMTSWLKNYGIWEDCGNNGQISDLLECLKDYQTDRLGAVTSWMKSSGAWDKCQNWWDIKILLKCLKDYPTDILDTVTTWMKYSGFWDKCRNGEEIFWLLKCLKDYPTDILDTVTTWMKSSGAWDKCQNWWDIKILLKCLKDYPTDILDTVTSWMKSSDAIGKCQNGQQIKELFECLKDYPTDRLTAMTSGMKNSGIWGKCKTGWEILDLLLYLKQYPVSRFYCKDYPAARFIAVQSWMQSSNAVEKCRNNKQIEELFECLKDYPIDRLDTLTSWMKDSGVWDKCGNGEEIKDLLECLKDYPADSLGTLTSWMKDSGTVGKCSNERQIMVILSSLKNIDLKTIQDTSKTLPIDHDHSRFYTLMYKFFPQDERFKIALCTLLADQSKRVYVIMHIKHIFGEESPVTEEFIYLVSGLDNNSAVSSFAVHKEMQAKRAQPVTHPLGTCDGVLLNPDIVKQPQSLVNPVHIPLNQWDRLFARFQGYSPETVNHFQELLGISDSEWSNLIKLQDNQFLRNLLDPKDSFVVTGYVGPLSRKFREILRDILDPNNDNPGAFLQLLLNIQTCSTGKENGILHYWNTKDNSRELDEGVLQTQGFVTEITAFFVEELRRSRYNMLSIMLMKEFPNCNLQHSLHYLNGVIGSEIGLSQAEDMPTFDIHSSCVDQGLRDTSKQELLDLFYKQYTPEYVIDRILGMLNDGSVQITNSTGLTLRILNEFLSGAYFAFNTDGTGQMNLDLVEVDANGAPVKFKAEAAKRILVTLGILI